MIGRGLPVHPEHPARAEISASTVQEVCAAVQDHERVIPTGGSSKAGLLPPPADAVRIRVSGLRGVSAYDPAEFTLTAAAGTPLAEVKELLAGDGQYLPFDPPLVGSGATLGGAVASGLGGSGRFRYGGVRDFLIGVRFVDGRGTERRGGGKVVKNAAGFDLPKLLVGSLGRLGVLTEVTFKVFPAPQAAASTRLGFPTTDAAVDGLVRLTRAPFDIDALDLVPEEHGTSLWLRTAGLADTLPRRLRAIAIFAREALPGALVDTEPTGAADAHWREMETLGWATTPVVARVAVTPARIRVIDPILADRGAIRRYSGGGTSLWLGWPDSVAELDALLREREVPGLCLSGGERPWIGRLTGQAFLRRVATTIDPRQKFGALAALGD